MKIILNREKGITLITLVVTIVVLLILAGVSISMLTGENGIIKQAQNSKEETRGGAVEEARDLWRADKKTDELTNSDTAQTLDELLNDLVKDKLLSEEEKEEIKETGKVTIGSRTIDFDLTKKLDIYPSIRINNDFETIILAEVSVPSELIKKNSIIIEIIEVAKSFKIPEETEISNMSIQEKENIITEMLFLMINLQTKQFGEYIPIEDTVKEICYINGMAGECNTLEELYNTMKKQNDEEIPSSYEEFIDSEIIQGIELINENEEFTNKINQMKEIEVTDEMLMYFWDKNITFQYIITKPDGSKIIDKIEINSVSFYGPWFAIEVPVDEFGEYQITVRTLDREYEGLTSTEYTDNRYLVTWEMGEIDSLYDTQTHNLVTIDKLYMCVGGERIEKTELLMGSRYEDYNYNYIVLTDLDVNKGPFELEFIKNDEKSIIPVLIIKNLPPN